jgi:hypothetical protein
MKQKIEALSNAFNIGFKFGALPYSCGKHTNSTKAALKRAIEEGLNIMSSEQCDAPDDSAAHRDWKHDIYKQCDRS